MTAPCYSAVKSGYSQKISNHTSWFFYVLLCSALTIWGCLPCIAQEIHSSSSILGNNTTEQNVDSKSHTGSGIGMHFDELHVGSHTFMDVTITRISPDRIFFNHDSGVASLPLVDLPEHLQKQFHFDPDRARKFQINQKEAASRIIQQREQENQIRQEKKQRQEREADIEIITNIHDSLQQGSENSEQSISQKNNPEFNGIPLSEILSEAIISTSRSAIYSLSDDGHRQLCEAKDIIYSKFSKNNSSYDAYSERWKQFQKLGKQSFPEKVLGYVRPGLIFRELSWKHSDSAPIFFPKKIGGMQFGAVHWNDFLKIGSKSSKRWWNEGNNDSLSNIPDFPLDIKFNPYPLTTNTLLLDPFEATDPILSNTEKSMLNAWTIQSSTISTNKNLVLNEGVLSVVETPAGLFLGYLIEKGKSGLSEMTWEQTITTQNMPFILKVSSKKTLKSGAPIFSLFYAKERVQKRLPTNNILEFILPPETFLDILKKGPWALKTSLSVPNDSGFESLQELETQATYQFEIQKKLERIQVQFDAINTNKLRILIVSAFKIREVERNRNNSRSETTIAKPWRTKKEQLSSEIDLSADGSIQFTDGEQIYYLAQGLMKNPELIIYKIEKNQLVK